MMKLIGSYTSPYTRKARIVLAEKNLDAQFVLDLPWSPTTVTPQFNPLGKVPVLVLDDGTTLFDSRVIVEYLDHIGGGESLLGNPGLERIAIKRWEALADGLSDAAAAIVIENRRAESERSAMWIARQQGKLDAGLQLLARDLGQRTQCHGNRYTLADIAVCCALGFIAFRLPQIDWRGAHPNLARLYDSLMIRATFQDTAPHD